MPILSIQSHVAYGRVGNRSAVFPLERLGFEVWSLNTVQFSNHPGYGSWTGELFSPRHVELVFRGIRELGVLGDCEALLSGYLGEAAVGRVILEALREVRAANPRALYCLDPVMGDYGRGVYVKPDIPGFIREEALPACDIVTPNQFEAELLSGVEIRGIEEAKEACRRIRAAGPRLVLVTSFRPASGAERSISMFLADGEEHYVLSTPELSLDPEPNGAGDLCSALLLGGYLRTGSAPLALERAADSVFSVLERTREAGSRELRIVEAQDSIAHPARRFEARRV